MPHYISSKGLWFPAKERVALKNLSGKPKEVDGEVVQPGEEYIYKGPDRAALFDLWKEGVDTFGQDFRKNPEFLQGIRNQGFQNVEDFLKFVGYDEKADEEKFKEKAAKITKHELPKKVKAIEVLGGGQNTAGDGDRYGGFGDVPKD